MTQTPKIHYRKDYTPPTHLIDNAALTIEIEDKHTKVFSKLTVRKNPKDKTKTKDLVLDGQDQVLESVKINGNILLSDQYKLDAEHLTLLDVPSEFTLEIESLIKPQENFSLMGLYKSNDLYCTQCEAEGFRKITYYLDRPDVLASFTTTIIADKKRYPVLLSNGNMVDYGDLTDGLHFIKWEDPFKKPSYLFAMVAGDLDYIEGYFTTMTGRMITIRIFSEKGNQDKCRYAMTSVQKSMKWDEEHYGREYDLDLFMILAVGDFNMGAMENKGLNIFNSRYIFADPKTATDRDYQNIDSVVAHEYFHNWSGDRVTCRDWFQLSLKEGFTVFRDQSFTQDMTSKAIARIDDVETLRNAQFPEDAGPLAHPVRPDSYMEINNFYTATVYEKGAEVIRMMHTILGPDNYRKGTDLYFERFDGQAVTCDDFVAAMSEASGMDLTQFKLWYSQAGTPELFVTSNYDETQKTYAITVKQTLPKTPGQDKKEAMLIPLAIGLLDEKGDDIKHDILLVKAFEQTFTFENLAKKPVALSLLRGFSAPIKLHYDYTEDELAFLMAHDNDGFARFEAGQRYAIAVLFKLMDAFRQNQVPFVPENFVKACREILLNSQQDKALAARMLSLPSEHYLGDLMEEVDVDLIHKARQFLKTHLAHALEDKFLSVYKANQTNAPYAYTAEEAARRSLKNTCLHYLTFLENHRDLAVLQFDSTDNMTDQMAALSAFANIDDARRDELLNRFYALWKNDPLVVNKWLTVQALSTLPNTLDKVIDLTNHPAFNLKNPNKVYALIRAFAGANQVRFHDISGKGYAFFADQLLKLDKFNPLVAGRLADGFSNWQRFDKTRQNLMKEQLKRILAEPSLSKDVYEVISKTLS